MLKTVLHKQSSDEKNRERENLIILSNLVCSSSVGPSAEKTLFLGVTFVQGLSGSDAVS